MTEFTVTYNRRIDLWQILSPQGTVVDVARSKRRAIRKARFQARVADEEKNGYYTTVRVNADGVIRDEE